MKKEKKAEAVKVTLLLCIAVVLYHKLWCVDPERVLGVWEEGVADIDLINPPLSKIGRNITFSKGPPYNMPKPFFFPILLCFAKQIPLSHISILKSD